MMKTTRFGVVGKDKDAAQLLSQRRQAKKQDETRRRERIQAVKLALEESLSICEDFVVPPAAADSTQSKHGVRASVSGKKVSPSQKRKESVGVFTPRLPSSPHAKEVKLSPSKVRSGLLSGKSCTKKSAKKHETEKQGKNTKHVKFHWVTIYEHALILGDNPSAAHGPPTTLDWASQDVLDVSLDYYEDFHCRDRERRERKALIMPAPKRSSLLLRAGYNLDDIANATLAARKVQSQRVDSMKQNSWENRFHFMVERAMEGVKIFSRPGSSRAQTASFFARSA